MIVKKYFSQDQKEDFYAVMGTYFANRKIARELGSQLYNEDKSVWFILFDEEIVVGFLSLFAKNNYFVLDNVYILPNYRNSGNFQFLLSIVLIDYGSFEIRLVASNPIAIYVYRKFGFMDYGKAGRWLKMRRPSNDLH